PDGTLLAAASAAGGITLYDAATGAVKHRLTGHTDGTNCLAWCPTAPELASGGQDGCVKFWSAATGEELAETNLGPAWVEHLAWTTSARANVPHSALLFAAAGKKLVALHADGTAEHTFADAPKTISALAASPGATLGSASAAVAVAYFGGVCVWDAGTFQAHKEFAYGNTIHALVWSPDGRWLVAGCQDNAVHLWVPAEDLELHMSGYETKLKELSFSQDSKWLATGGGRDACVWDCSGAGPEGREPLALPHNAPVTTLAFQHQHGLLATGSANGEFTLWSPTRKNPLVAEVKMPSAATKFSWRTDDTLLAVGTASGQLFVFKTA
ncbi:MAG: WD40 repeat domain-containing protein, partial [Candidatus Didemnitutus sp.]|nr:WD40 repeat domain-containing protein [Candidatus Didemnitutus sp.]